LAGLFILFIKINNVKKRYVIEDVTHMKYYDGKKLVATKFIAKWYKTKKEAINAYKDKLPFIIHEVYIPSDSTFQDKTTS
jgi:hypothetical protein